MRGLGALLILFVLIVAWLAVTAPLSKSLQPPMPPSITLLASDGTPIARRGAIIGKPVDAAAAEAAMATQPPVASRKPIQVMASKPAQAGGNDSFLSRLGRRLRSLVSG